MTRGRTSRTHSGAAALELALMLPLFLLLIIGILEFGRAVSLVQILTSGCREACRQAIIPGANDANILSVANNYLSGCGVSQTGRIVLIRNAQGEPASLDPSSPDYIGPHERVTVHIEVPFDQNTFGISIWFLGRNLVTEVSMRRE